MQNFDTRDEIMEATDTTGPSAMTAPGTLAILQRAEIDGQIATARAFPRSMAGFIKEARALVSLDQDTAESCIYSLPRMDRGEKVFITGPSVRFAEVIMHAYGNSRCGGRIVDEGDTTITAQGVFHDLEKNTMITREVARGIMTSPRNGLPKRFGRDMINVTGNAAISLALRNAILSGIPKAIWLPIYEAAKMVAIGDITTLVDRRKLALGWFVKVGVTEEQILAKLGVEGVEDIGLEHLEQLTGIKTAIRGGHLSPESAFAPEPPAVSDKAAGLAERVAAARDKPKDPPAKSEPKPKVESKADAPAKPAADPEQPLPDGPLFTQEPDAGA